MAMPSSVQQYTVEDVLRLFPESKTKYELLYGELFVSPPPALRHQALVQRLYRRLVDYLGPFGLDETVFCTAVDISWDNRSVVEPDLFVAPPEQLRSNRRLTIKTLLLAVEVLSPRSSRADRVLKRRLYQENRVAAYWVVDHRAGLVEVWTPGDERPQIVTDVLRWRVAPDAPECEIELAPLFEGLPPPQDDADGA